MKKVLLLIFFIFVYASIYAQLAEDFSKLRKVNIYNAQQKEVYVDKSNIKASYLIGKQLFRFYKGFISSQDANNCPFSPSCSVYMLKSIEKKGFLFGFLNGLDRLMRCNGRDLDKYHIDNHSKQLIDIPVKYVNQ